jgi:membrane protease YdiL (CAAX protease family)
MKTLSRLFISPDERRLRSGWRLILQFVLMMVLSLLFVPLVMIAAGLLPGIGLLDAGGELSQESGAGMLAGQAMNLLGITVSVYLARRFLDRRSFRSLGLERAGASRTAGAGRGLLFGFVLAALMMGLIYVVESALGWLRFEGMAWQSQDAAFVLGNTLLWLAIFVMVGWQEELLSRGYWLRNLIDGLNVPLAALLSSLGFSLLHLNNPNISWTAIVGLVAAGLWFAFAALVTKQLWVPIGAHIGWNFFEATVFGFPVSGMDTFGVIRQTPTGPVVWTGGAFGPEAGLIVLPALALGALAVWWAYGRKRVAG